MSFYNFLFLSQPMNQHPFLFFFFFLTMQLCDFGLARRLNEISKIPSSSVGSYIYIFTLNLIS